MNLPFFTPRAGAIGLDISGRWIKVAQVTRASHRGSFSLLATARIPRADPRAEFGPADAEMVAGAIDRAGFEGRTVVLGAPRELLVCDVLELPPRSSGAPIEQLARVELARTSRWESSSFELGLWDLPVLGRPSGTRQHSEATHVFAAALSHELAEPILASLEAAALEVIAVDVPALAIARACMSMAATPFTALLDVGYQSSLFVVLHDGLVVYERSIAESSLGGLFASVKARVGIDEDAAMLVLSGEGPIEQPDAASAVQSPAAALRAEARACLGEFIDSLVPEVQRSLSYVAHRSGGSVPLSRLLLTGDGADLGGIRDRLATTLSVPVMPAGTELLGGQAGGAPLGSLVTAVGLSQYTLADQSQRRAAA
jgi:Tfp pilus assembly PilM family ATPase